MIPKSNKDGYLPKGIHKATLTEIGERFGSSSLLVIKMDFDFGSPEAEKLRAAKELFGAHLFIFTEKDVSRYHRLVNFFGHDRDQKPKGLLEVIL